jgi:hypothetical protein
MRRLTRVESARQAVRRGALAGVLAWVVVVPPGPLIAAWYDRQGPHEMEAVGFYLGVSLVDLLVIGVLMAVVRVPAPPLALIGFTVTAIALTVVVTRLPGRLMPTPATGFVVAGLTVGVMAGISGSALGWRAVRSRPRTATRTRRPRWQ